MNMRAKMQVRLVESHGDKAEKIHFTCVTGKEAFGPEGESEDNTFARYTPQGEASFVINNPSLVGQFYPGQAFYVDFTRAE